MLTRIDPPLPLSTPKGDAMAHFVVDYGTEHHLIWVCFLDSSGECWCVPNPEIRMKRNWSFGRRG